MLIGDYMSKDDWNYDEKGEEKRYKVYVIAAIVLVAGILIGMLAAGRIDISGIINMQGGAAEVKSSNEAAKITENLGSGLSNVSSSLSDIEDILGS